MDNTSENYNSNKLLETQEELSSYKKQVVRLKEKWIRSQWFVDLTDDLLTQVDKNGIFLFVNKISKNIFGWDPDEMIGRSAFDFVHPDDREITKQAFLQWQDGKKKIAYFKNRQISKCGDIFFVSWIINLHYDVSGEVTLITCIAKDTTKSQELEKTATKLKERVKEINCLYKISKLAEDETLTIDFLMEYVVNLIPSSFQYPEITCAVADINNVIYKTGFFKKTKWELSSPIKVDSKKNGFLKVYYTKDKLTLDKEPFLKEERDLVDSVCKSVSRILERMKFTQKLTEIEDRYKILTNKFADGIVIIQDDQYKFTNNSFAVMLGCPHPKYLVNKKFRNYLSPKFYTHYKESILISLETGNIKDKKEYQLFSKNKQKIWVEEKRNVINWNDAPALLCIIRDITEAKQREAFSKNETRQLREENIRLRSSLKERFRFRNIIGKSEAMQQVYDLILNAANSDANVSIYGESGTGKELVANAIHELSERKKNVLVPVNCGAIPESLLESEFFGYKKGAFTGAAIDKRGYLDLADKGSLFLDEIGELQLNMQVKLLRAIDGGGYHPIGSNEKRQANFRIISATNKNLKNELINGTMREDFYYRIHVIPITLPPLRERKDDIPYLVEHFSKIYSEEAQYSKIPKDFLEKIYTYDWPGNVRELQNVLLRFFSTGQFVLFEQIDDMSDVRGTDSLTTTVSYGDSLSQRVENYEKSLILKTLKDQNWHRINASEKLKLTRNTLFRKMNKYGLNTIHK